jgi:serine kinase of HPr protein (carbohydrate metabolism regulator)
MADTTNIHGTAIVVGTTGLLFLGVSGVGKSSLAFACLASAKQLGMFSALVADDRVLLTKTNDVVFAECPASIAGLIEIRGTGILRIPSVSSAKIDFAVLPGDPLTSERLPPDEEQIAVTDCITLPAIRLSTTTINPLAIIMAKHPDHFRQ